MNYCINLKKRKNKPFCKLLNKEIPFSCCQECDNKEYKKDPANINIKRKNPNFRSINPELIRESNNNQIKKNAQSLEKIVIKKTKMHNKSKKLINLEKNRFSVFSNNTKNCYLCGSTYNLTWHEIYSGRNRQNSMKYGLCLRLCLNCHEEKQEDVNFNEFWHKKGQVLWENEIGSREEFIKVFRKNYL
mgnify:CR=1 FL=1